MLQSMGLHRVGHDLVTEQQLLGMSSETQTFRYFAVHHPEHIGPLSSEMTVLALHRKSKEGWYQLDLSLYQEGKTCLKPPAAFCFCLIG